MFFRYKKKALSIGKLINDQPMTGLEKVIWWTEYVIRNKGVLHLQNPRVYVSWFEFLILDVVAFLISLLILFLGVVYKTSKFVSQLVYKSRQIKQKSQ